MIYSTECGVTWVHIDPDYTLAMLKAQFKAILNSFIGEQCSKLIINALVAKPVLTLSELLEFVDWVCATVPPEHQWEVGILVDIHQPVTIHAEICQQRYHENGVGCQIFDVNQLNTLFKWLATCQCRYLNVA